MFFLALLGLASGCAHTPQSSGKSAAALPMETKLADTQALLNSAADEPQIALSEPLPVAEPHNDVLARITAGFAFPNFESEHIAGYEKWNSEHPTYLVDLFARAEPFLFHIVEEIERRGLPMELALLPAIESAFKPNAISRSRAGGLWQFIPSTGKHFGLRQDWWYDGRRDVLAATDAALDYLVELNGMFDGDWFLTLAAYNAGPGTLNKALRYNQRNKRGLNYTDLDLRTETKRYVPKLIALKNILLNPEKHQVTLPIIPNHAHFQVVQLPGQIDFHGFAELSEVDLATLQHLNAAYLRWATSPDGPHRLLVPIGAIENVEQALLALQQLPSVQFRDHKIKRGDSLSSIAYRYKVSVAALKKANQLSSSAIRQGKTLLVPIADRSTGNSIAKRLDQQRQDQQRHANLPTKAHHNLSASATQASGDPLQSAEIALASAQQFIHRVSAGETLWSIARRYQVKVGQLMSWNQLQNDHILNLNQPLTVFSN